MTQPNTTMLQKETRTHGVFPRHYRRPPDMAKQSKRAAIFNFLICGGSAAAINWLARIILSLFLPFLPSVLIAYGIGLVVGFVLYRFVVWQANKAPLGRQIARFLIVNAGGAATVLIVSLGLTAGGDLLWKDPGVVEAIAHGIAIGLGAVANYYGHSRFTFAAGRPPREAAA
jgi:energy-coupling factor transport system substrate-specific component